MLDYAVVYVSVNVIKPEPYIICSIYSTHTIPITTSLHFNIIQLLGANRNQNKYLLGIKLQVV